MNKHVERALCAGAIAGVFAISAYGGIAIAHADNAIPTVNLSDVPWIDQLPICIQEDCSDQIGQIGVWTSREGNAYIELGENVTVMVIDDTTTKGE